MIDAKGGPVEICGAPRIAELVDGEEDAGREVGEDVRLSCGFREGWVDQFTCVCGCHGVAFWHHDYNGIDGGLFVHMGGGWINVVAGGSRVGYCLFCRWGTI